MIKKLISMLAMIATMILPTYALELPKGAKKVSDSESVGIFVNRKLTVTLYDTKSGKKVGSGIMHHRSDGVKVINISYKGKRIKKNLKWKISGSRLCAGSIGEGKTVCGAKGLYKKGNQCYHSPDGKMVGTSFSC